MRITVAAVFSLILGSSSAFTQSSQSRDVPLTRLNLGQEEECLPSNPEADDRRTFVSKVSTVVRDCSDSLNVL